MKNINIGILAHVDAGKTTLSEALLYKAGVIKTLGRVDHRSTFLDTDTQERDRGITIFSKQAKFNTENVAFTLLDTPGHVDFSSETERTLQVLDYAILVISGSEGIQSHTETLWKLLKRYRVPTFIYVNKMDRPDTDREVLTLSLKRRLSSAVTDLSLAEDEDLAVLDDYLLNNYLETGEFDKTLIPLLIKTRKLFPVYFGSALKLEGIDELLSALDLLTLEPEYDTSFSARVFKITRDSKGERLTWLKVTGGTLAARQSFSDSEKINQIRDYSGEKYTTLTQAEAGKIVAITGLTQTIPGQGLGAETDEVIPVLEPILSYSLMLPDGASPATALPLLNQLGEEDPTLSIFYDELLREIQIRVMGAVQIEILKNLIKERFNLDVTFGEGKIIYKETIADVVEGVGHFEPLRHYAEVHLLLAPARRGSGLIFNTNVSEDLLAKNWQRLILTHLQEKRFKGVLTGCPITDMEITVVGGRAHKKHTEGGDFRQATYRAVRQGLMQADSVLLEPYYAFSLTLATTLIGRAMTDLESMHGSFTLETDGDETTLTGRVPVSTFRNYQEQLNIYSSGRYSLSLKSDGYDICHNADEVIERFDYDPERDTRNSPDSVFCSHGSGFIVPWYDVNRYMHVPSVFAPAHIDNNEPLAAPPETDFSDEDYYALGTDEIDDIINNASHANAGKNPKKRAFHKKSSSIDYDKIKKQLEAVNKSGISTKKKELTPYLLVDGYNVIFAWEELNDLARDNLDGARGRLLDILCNYQGITGVEVIVVFDAYRVKGHSTEILDYHNIHVVYTKEAETADRYIEKFAHENSGKKDIRVATSDGLEQVIIIGEGCRIVSSREFEAEVKKMAKDFNDEYLNKVYKG